MRTNKYLNAKKLAMFGIITPIPRLYITVYLVTTDASKYVIGGILSQGEIGKDRPITYVSRLLNAAKQNYSTILKGIPNDNV